MLNKKGQRELAYGVKVEEIKPLEGYDRVEYARIGSGWWCVVKKDDFKVGDIAVYFEIDSKLPEKPEFEFCARYNYRVKTQKLCKVLSQGLLMHPRDLNLKDVKEGDFLTEKLEVTYYEAEDNTRKADISRYTSMKARHQKFFKTKLGKWLMKREWGRKLCFLFLGKKKDKKIDWPKWVVKTDEDRCLGANVKITTDKGLIRIADIVNKKLPVKVKSWNSINNQIEYKKILDYQSYKKNPKLLEIRVPFSIGAKNRGRTILCTPDHKFFTPKGYVEADKLNIGDEVYTVEKFQQTERLLPIKIIDIKEQHTRKYTYDIEVADNHNFFANGVLTHNCQNVFNRMKSLNLKWIVTEKIDGSSTTFTMKQDKPKKRKLLVCSRNVVFDKPEKEEKNFYKDTDGNIYLEMAEKYHIDELCNKILDNHKDWEFITIQGETYGGKIQQRDYGKEHRCAIFNIIYKKDGDAPVRLNPIEMHKFLLDYEEFELEGVPVVDTISLPETCEEILKYAGSETSRVDNNMREGVVLRSLDGKWSFKAVDNNYLLKYHS